MAILQTLRSVLRLAFLTLALAGGATSALADNYRIKTGDTLQIEVLEDMNLSRPVLVLPDGNINFPFAGTIRPQAAPLALYSQISFRSLRRILMCLRTCL